MGISVSRYSFEWPYIDTDKLETFYPRPYNIARYINKVVSFKGGTRAINTPKGVTPMLKNLIRFYIGPMGSFF